MPTPRAAAAPPPQRPDTSASPPLDDPGGTQVLLFVGWVPPAIAALVTGVILIVFAEGDGDSLLAGIMAGTIVGYVAGLTFHFALGVRLQRRGASPWTADGFLLLSTVVGVVAGVAMAVLGWIDNSLVLIPIVLTIGFVIVAIVAATRGD